jgi:hypothetical protein
LRICDWIETSSAETGSSAMISFGRRASARATPIRGEPDDLEQLLDPALALRLRPDPVDLQRVADDRAHALPRVEGRIGVLEDHLHLAAQ